jgi:dTDP-glucose pyrophosphorylase
MKKNIFIPLGGIGQRFKDCGYKLPKPLINVFGKPILYWLLDNLNEKLINIIIIGYNYELEKYNFEDQLKKNYPNIKFIFNKINNCTNGALETIYKTIQNIDINIISKFLDDPILCLDGDNFYMIDILKIWNNNNCVFTFYDENIKPIYSYVKINENNEIKDIQEKNKISNFASTGAYGFNSLKLLYETCEYIISNNIRNKNEYYISNAIEYLIKNNNIFNDINIDINNYVCLGTPLHIRLFCNNYPVINANNKKKILKPKRFCFDLENTLLTYPKIKNDYKSVKPILKNINFLKYLKKMGNIIIIYTTQKISTYEGKIIFEILEKYNIPYDEIYFGKPEADYYIDNLSYNSYENLEKELGYFINKIDTRNFNKIEGIDINIYQKSSNDKSILSGEIYYYSNIPIEIKDMFPIMFDYDNKNYKWYNIEKINGMSISNLYLNEELTIEQFNNVYNSIKRIHECKINDKKKVNIYLNYCTKLINRFNYYNYERFKGSKKIYDRLKKYFEEYEKNDEGKISVIHGDPVFTNILINQFGKIKFIDMKGKQDNIYTIYGDSFYDWAKIYQSLLGYDEILYDKYVNIEYKKKFIEKFKEKFIEDFSLNKFEQLKWITKLLLFTLIPLHNNNDKCKKYYELILN